MSNPGSALPPVAPPVAATGIAGLDSILQGGFPRDEMHLVQGGAGTGKTTIALRFLCEGVRAGESTLYLTLSQSKEHLERIARSHGWPLDGMTIHELSPGTVADRIAARQSILPTADVELGELFRELVELVTRVAPRRAVIDSITVLQILSGTPQRYHREVVTLRQLFIERRCTVMALADHPAETVEGLEPEVVFHPLAGCVIHLEQEPRAYGDVRRRLRVVKARGLANNGGYHDFKIRTGNPEVYARLGAYEQPEDREYRTIGSNVESVDAMLGGGLPTGTSCLIVGASGVGKSSLAALFVDAAARAGDHAAIYLLDERPATYVTRSTLVGIELRDLVESGRILIQQLDPGEIAPGELAQQVRGLVETRGTKVVVIDSVNGYFAAMGSADVLVTQLHELMTYLTRRGVLLILCGAQEGFMSIGGQKAVDVSYLSDTILFLSFFEADGDLRRALAVVKKKQGTHLSTIHELSLVDGHIHVGSTPLAAYRNLMVPTTQADGGG
jgi:circadian clock protein KaiC